MTAKEFLLKKFPTNKYWDCPVPKHHWEIMEEYAKAYHEEQVKLLATTAVSVELPLTEARLSALHDIAKQYCYTTQDDSPTISRKGVELLLVEYSKGN
jgi:hypothetical protein